MSGRTSQRLGIRVIALLVAVSVVLSACASTLTRGNIAERPVHITATVGMITDIARNVGGDRVIVTGLMGPGVDPHYYKPSARDILRLDDADLILYGGLHLEGRMVDVFEKLEKVKPVVAVSRDIPDDLLRRPIEFEGNYDPHIWFDVTLWEYAVGTIRDELMTLDPTHAETYRQNAAAYLQKLAALDQHVKQQINSIPPQARVLITAHDAFGYFGRRYGVEVRGLQGTSTATEAGAGDVRALATFIAERKIKAIFVESSVPAATVEAVQAAVQSRGWDVRIGGQLFSDAMGDAGTFEGTYIGMVTHNADTIAAALR